MGGVVFFEKKKKEIVYCRDIRGMLHIKSELSIFAAHSYVRYRTLHRILGTQVERSKLTVIYQGLGH
jgi:hypothetical protein